MKAILHIGTEKTATTTLQVFLAANRDQLAQQGFGVLTSPDNTNRDLVSYCMDDGVFDDYFTARGITTIEEKNRLFENFETEFARNLDSLPSGVEAAILTSEHFHSRLVSLDSIRFLKTFLEAHFDEIAIVCYFREQSAIAKSHYSTAMRVGIDISFPDFLKNVEPGNDFYNYFVFFSKWADVFGAESLNARIFSDDRLVDTNIMRDFSAHLQCDPTDLNFSIAPKNESLGYLGLALCRVVNQLATSYDFDPQHSRRGEMINQIVRSPLAKKGAVPFDQAPSIYAAFDESNRMFAERFLGSDENPFEPPGDVAANDADLSFYDETADLVRGLLEARLRHPSA